ncbi:MAG TPA: endolytic transglycosylase MltG [Sulfurivirga caldicuralii]|nr:endolytic transglycosylase MltG [Sulfurivirga caldicuralii]
MVRRMKWTLAIGAGLLLGVAVVLAVIKGMFDHPLLPRADQQVLAVAPSVAETLQRLEAHGLKAPWLFKVYLWWAGLDRRIQAGEVRLNAHWNMAQLAQALVSGPRVQYAITLIPGTTFDEAWQKIRNHPKIKVTLADKVEARRRLQVKALEGQLLPETYFFPANTTDAQLLRMAHRALWDYLQQAWPKRAPELPLKTPYEALILASIVEKETGRAEERALIAGVFINRLRKGMRLQSDPTTIYGLGEAFDGNLTRAHLRQYTPYNTYRIKRLPPTPIALASRQSIDAVLHPAATRALYFVAKGDGSHHFSATLAEHNRAVRRYQKGQ